MDYLSKNAASDLYDLISWSHYNCIIERSQYLHRLEALVQMLKPKSKLASYINEIFEFYEWVADKEWEVLEKNLEFSSENKKIKSESEENSSEEDAEDEGEDEDEDPVITHFHPAISTGLSKWFFIIGDPDNFPSVPHGHFDRRSKHKLDPYLGWVYMSSKQINRLSRKLIIRLWNEDEFRSFAKSAILQFITDNPSFNWRVPHPKKLPKKRMI